MNNMLNNAIQTMSSLEIAEATGKQHKHVMADVRKMLDKLEKDSAEFSAQYKDSTGRSLSMFALDRFHTEVLVTGYDVKRRAAVIQRWHDLESGEATPWYQQETKPETPQLPDFTNPAEAARAWADQHERADEAVAALEDAREELDFVTVQEYVALSHRYMSQGAKARLGKTAAKVSRELGLPTDKQTREIQTPKGIKHRDIGVYTREALVESERRIDACV